MVYTAVALRTLRIADVTSPPRGGGLTSDGFAPAPAAAAIPIGTQCQYNPARRCVRFLSLFFLPFPSPSPPPPSLSLSADADYVYIPSTNTAGASRSTYERQPSNGLTVDGGANT